MGGKKMQKHFPNKNAITSINTGVEKSEVSLHLKLTTHASFAQPD
jgi:hypothetical protein